MFNKNTLKSYRKQFIIEGVLLFAAYIICYWHVIQGMALKWLNNEDYQYALFVPFVIIYLIWEKRRQIAEVDLKPYPPGGIILILVTLLGIYGIVGSDISAARLSWWLMAYAIILFCYGRSLTRLLFYPLLFVGFMIPLPSIIFAPLTINLKLLSSRLAGFILELSGITSVVEGNVIDIGITQLEVVEACSGMRFVLSLACVSLLFIHFFQKSWWKKCIIFLSVLPFSIVANAIRIWIIAFSTIKGWGGLTEGFVHYLLGWAIFLIAFLLILILNKGLDFFFPPCPPAQETGKRKNLSVQTEPSKYKAGMLYIVLTLTTLIVIILLQFSVATFPRLYFPDGLMSLPLMFKGWRGRESYINPSIIPYAGAEDAIVREYWEEKGQPVNLYIGYRSAPFLEGKDFFHSPNVCYPAMGWEVLEEGKYLIESPSRIFTVRRMLIEKYGKQYLLFFWFQTRKHISNIIFQNRWHLTKHALLGENTPDLIVSIMTEVDAKGGINRSEERLGKFAKDLEGVISELMKQLIRVKNT